MIIKQFFSYYLLSLLLIYLFSDYKNSKKNEHKIFKKLLIYFIEGHDYLLMNNYNKFYKNIQKCEDIMKQILKIIYKLSDSINISILNKINKINYLFNNINLTTIYHLDEFADTEIFGTNIIFDIKSYNSKTKTNIDIPFIKEEPKKEYSLVLDLDETLIHFSISGEKEGHLFFRPHLFKFLDSVSKFYEIIIFTAGITEYAKIVLNLIEIRMGRKIFDFRLYRECTIANDEGAFVKDLEKIGRNLQKIIIVDNTKENFELQKDNGIEIKSYYGFDVTKLDSIEEIDDIDDDNCLMELENVLVKIAEDKPKNITLALKMHQREIFEKVTYGGLYYDE